MKFLFSPEHIALKRCASCNITHLNHKKENNMIIQFSHPGKELEMKKNSRLNGHSYFFETSDTGIRYWNNENDHKRKFIKQRGWYLENEGNTFNPIPKEGELYFWGEWEPQSEFKLTGNRFSSQPSLPHAIHKPFLSNRGRGSQNTDPFIFGEQFYYTNCKQSQSGKGRKLLDLPTNSIILFGSEKDKKHFVIDTIFVVEDSETVASYRTHPNHYPQTLREVTIDLNGGLSNWNNIYKGKMYNFKKHFSPKEPYLFSYFPCKINCEETGFERPIIDWRKFGLQKPGAYTVLKEIDLKETNYNSYLDFWNSILSEILCQGCSLGIRLESPRINNNIDLPEYGKSSKNC